LDRDVNKQIQGQGGKISAYLVHCAGYLVRKPRIDSELTSSQLGRILLLVNVNCCQPGKALFEPDFPVEHPIGIENANVVI
jgi:hypothetical protein